jgi:hypothetical protein
MVRTILSAGASGQGPAEEDAVHRMVKDQYGNYVIQRVSERAFAWLRDVAGAVSEFTTRCLSLLHAPAPFMF